MKRGLIAVLLLFPALFFSKVLNFDTLSAILFVLIVLFLIIKNRKKLDWQSMFSLGKIPIVYAVLWRSNFGIRFMEKIAKKYRSLVKLLGYIFVGFGFFGMVYISINIFYLLIQLFTSPREASQAVSLVLPLTNIPGAGFLSFWHFILTLFITVLVHEFGHGIVALAHGVPIKNSGIGAFSLAVPIFPVAFVEPDEKKLEKQKDIVQYSIFSAGPIVNVCFAFLFLLVLNFVFLPVENKITSPVGFSFGALTANYSAESVGMKPNVIVNSFNGKTTLDYESFAREIAFVKPGVELKMGLENGTVYTVLTKPSPANPEKGFIGIQDPRNERKVKENFKAISGVFFWLKGLVKWLYFFNIIIGLMNLLPLLITDGGRILKVALEETVRDKKKAMKIWGFVSSIFIFTILFALFLKYLVFGALGI